MSVKRNPHGSTMSIPTPRQAPQPDDGGRVLGDVGLEKGKAHVDLFRSVCIHLPMVSKYDGLGVFLRQQTSRDVPMSFADIERVTGVRLPEKSQHSRAWWSNNAANNVMTKVWLDAGFETAEVDMKRRKVVFKRLRRSPLSGALQGTFTLEPSGRHPTSEEEPAMTGMAESKQGYVPQEPEQKQNRHPALGAMKGLFTIEPGYDLTGPVYTDEEWAEIEKEMEADWDQIAEGMSRRKQ